MKFSACHHLILAGILLFLALNVKSHVYANEKIHLIGNEDSCEEDKTFCQKIQEYIEESARSAKEEQKADNDMNNNANKGCVNGAFIP